MYLLQNYFDQMKAQTGQKSSNGTVLSKFFTPPTETVAGPIIDTKQAGDALGKAVVEVLKDFGKKNNVRFRLTRKPGKSKLDVTAPGESFSHATKEILEFWGDKNNVKFNFTRKQGRAK